MAATAEVVEDLEVRTHKRVRVFAEGAFVPTAEQHVELVKRNELDPEVTDLKSRTVDYFDENVRISYVHLSCNGRVLAFAVDSTAGSFVHLFDLLAFAPELSAQPFPLTSIRPSADGGRITCLEWNPEAEDVLAVGTADGTVTTFKFSLAAPAAFSIVGSAKLNAAPTCMSWSRKGKQLTVGDRAGRLHQLTPDIKPVRVTDAPQQIQGFAGPFVCAGVFWVATTDWLVAYRQHDDPLKLTLALLTVKKNVPPEWKFFGDVTFQRPNAPPMDTSLHFVPLMEWNLVFVYAHRSPDIVVIGQRNGQWVNFVMERFTATMPVDAKKADSYPLGVAVDLSSQVRVVLDRSNPESPVLPPQPAMFVLSSAGLLLSYNVCSLDPVRPQLNTQPIGFSPQDAVNGAPPAGYVPDRQRRSAELKHKRRPSPNRWELRSGEWK
ncbi:hypothetical protein M3Y99_01647900 [Aphelenchoides fujianensis]|nr:hypothetical protein M3Y99_01647900 [Aphelenchoides fujianensis]